MSRSFFFMNEKQIALIERVRTRFHQVVTKVERLRYIAADQHEVIDGALFLWFDDRVLCFDVEGDGERLLVSEEPWTDPFAEPLDNENAMYVAKHGKWILFDVSTERPYSDVVGASPDGILPIANALGRLTGVSLEFGETVLNVFAECDELLVTWGASNVPHWGMIFRGE